MVDRIDREREGFEVRVARARKTMIYKAAVTNGEVDAIVAKKITALMNEGSRSDSRMSDQSEHDQGTMTTGNNSTNGCGHFYVIIRLHILLSKLFICFLEDTPPLPRRRAKTEGSRGLEKLRKRKKIKVTISMVYSIILFAEFLKELSALSLEHSIINPEMLQIEEINR